MNCHFLQPLRRPWPRNQAGVIEPLGTALSSGGVAPKGRFQHFLGKQTAFNRSLDALDKKLKARLAEKANTIDTVDELFARLVETN